MRPNSKPLAILHRLQNTTSPLALPPARSTAAQFFGGGGAAAVDERDDEHVVVAQLVDDPPGVGGDLADLGVIELGHAPADARGVGKRCGVLEDVAHDGSGIGG